MKSRGGFSLHYSFMGVFSQKEDDEFSGLWGSLASRVMVVAMSFLVIPLIVHGLLTFYNNYQDEFQDLFLTLKVLGKGRAALLEQFDRLEYRFLDLTSELVKMKQIQPDVTDEQINGLLSQLKRKQNVTAIFYLEKQGNDWICTNSSNINMLGQNYSSFVNPLALSQEHVATIRWDPQMHQGYYLVSKRLYKAGSARINKMVNIVLSSKAMLDRISIIKKSDDPTRVAMLDKTGQVFLSTDPDFVFSQVLLPMQKPSEQAKKTVQLKTLHVDVLGAENNYEFRLDGEKQNGVLMPVESSDIRLLVFVPSHNFLVHFIETMYEVGILMMVVIIVGGLATWWLTHRMSRPFKALCKTMRNVEEGNLEARFQDQKMGFEINVVGGIFNHMIDSLLSHMHAAENERVAKETLAKELRIGQDVQKSILPKAVPAFSNLDIASGFVAAKEVGGDFYDIFTVQRQGDDHLMCVVADTAGKGISACFYSLGLRSMLRSYGALENDLGQVLLQTNNVFCQDTLDSGMFVTAWVAYIDEKTKKMSFSSCGHPPTLIKRKSGAIESLTTPGIALGVAHLDHIPTQEIQLETGDLLLLYSDGITEAHNNNKELFGDKRLADFLQKHPCDNAQKIVDDLMIEIGTFTTGVAQFDDMTVLVVRIL